MENFVPKNYTASGTLNFSSTGYMTCKNGDEQNIGETAGKHMML